jgi:uncharacterized protein (TIGR03083 family)
MVERLPGCAGSTARTRPPGQVLGRERSRATSLGGMGDDVLDDLPAASYDLATLLDAWESSLRAVVGLGRVLTPEQWAAPTECPGWSAGDVVRHLCWVEGFLADRSDAPHEVDWAAHPHVTNDFGRLTETGVDVRRHLEQAAVCDELDTLIDVRLAMIMRLDPLTLDTEVPGLFGKPVPLRALLRVRVFDIWSHEQDVRRAVGLPGNLASPGAQVSALQITASLPFVLAKGLRAAVGTTLLVSVTGPIAFSRCAAVGEDGRGVRLVEGCPPDDATLRLETDWETFARLSAGRLDVDDPEVRARAQVRHRSDVDDPDDLAGRLLAELAITP